MNKTDYITKQKEKSLFPVIIISVAVIIFITAMYISINLFIKSEQIKRLEEDREESESAIQKFSDASDLLTFEVQRFCITKDLNHANEYLKEAFVNKNREEAIYTLTSMNLSSYEKLKAREAEKNSNDLMANELWSMRLICESVQISEDDMPENLKSVSISDEEKNLTPDEKYNLAYNYIFGINYSEFKQNIYFNVSKFRYDLNNSYGTATTDMMNETQNASKWSMLLLLIMIMLLIVLVTSYIKSLSRSRESLIIAKNEADRANSAKTDFLSRMSHDIRTPLNGIIGMSSLTLNEEVPDKVRGELEKINSSGQFLLGLINDILDMTKVESGAMALHHEVYCFCEFKQYVDSVIAPMCEKKNMEFIMFDVEKLPCIITDKQRFNQIFFNLLSNAVKYTPNYGKVEFLIKNNKIEDGKFIADYIIRDNGIGMSKEFQEKMFDAFSQEKSDYKSEYYGSGLGLSIVKKLVDLYDGTISVNSSLNNGTEFVLHMSFLISNKYISFQKDKKVKIFDNLANKRILVCEDNELNAEITGEILKSQKVLVEYAENGSIGVDMFDKSEKGYYDVILMDIRMPIMDGIEATIKIRNSKHPDAKTVPIIAMTANVFDDDAKKSLSVGMNAYLTKPVNTEKLYETISSFL